jgi:hypothetical protein
MGHGKQKQEVQSNITDNQSAKITTSKGTIQGIAYVTADTGFRRSTIIQLKNVGN